MAAFEPVLTRNLNVDHSTDLKVYESRGGYQGARKALKMTPDEVVEEVKNANLRGRGGAGFPAGVKWTFLPKDRTTTYLCVNADSSVTTSRKSGCASGCGATDAARDRPRDPGASGTSGEEFYGWSGGCR